MVIGHLERLANRLDAPVHHVRRRNDLRPGLGMRQGLAHQRIDGHIVLHVALFVEDAVLAMGSERVERDIGDDAKLGKAFAQSSRGTLSDTVRIPGFRRIQRLFLQRRDGKQRQRGNTQRHPLLGLLQQQIDRQPFHTGHRRHLFAAILAVEDEHRQDQIIDGQPAFTHQAARKLIAAITTQTGGGKQPIGWNETHSELLARSTGEYDVYKPTS